MKNQTFTVKDGREGAVLILLYGFEKGIGLREIEREVLAGSNLNRPAVSFMTELVRGTLERLLTIDYCIGKFSKTAVRKMKPLIRSDLRVAVYQLLYLTKTPASAVVNTAVTIAGQHGFTGLKGFVNGLLRNISRCRDELIEEVSSAKDPEVLYSVPSFVIDLLTADYGEEKTEKILAAIQEKKPLSGFAVTKNMSREDLLSALEKEGFQAVPDVTLSAAFSLAGSGAGITETKSFKKGAFYICDRSSMADGEALLKILPSLPENNIKLLDICASPGGKSVQAADILSARGEVISRDVSEKKVARIRENAERTGLSNIHPEVADATVFDPASEGAYDAVIADVPCSGLGVMGMKPDIRYRQDEKSMADIVALQRSILKNAVAYVKAGGYMIYSTCTLHKKENEDHRHFVESSGFTLVSEETRFPDEGPWGGFYTAVLRKN